MEANRCLAGVLVAGCLMGGGCTGDDAVAPGKDGGEREGNRGDMDAAGPGDCASNPGAPGCPCSTGESCDREGICDARLQICVSSQAQHDAGNAGGDTAPDGNRSASEDSGTSNHDAASGQSLTPGTCIDGSCTAGCEVDDCRLSDVPEGVGGACEAVADPFLPFEPGLHMGVTQGPGCYGHMGKLAEAYDFNVAGTTYERVSETKVP